MARTRDTWLVYNAASGSNDDAVRAELTAALADAGFPVIRELCFPEEPAPTPEDLRRQGVLLLAVFAGDGTINSVVTGLFGWEGAVLVLPGGTMNLLSRRLHGDAGVLEIVARLGRGLDRTVRPPLIHTRLGNAFAEVITGPGTAWNEVREAVRDADVAEILTSATEAIGESAAGPRVVCSDPPCGRPEGYPAIMLTPARDGLEGTGYYAETLGDYARQGVALLQRDFRSGPHEPLGSHDRVQLTCPDGHSMGLLIDGESREGSAQEEFTVARFEVDLVATARAR